MNENQNVFLGDGKRTTSRVTNEPGGKSSVQLGWDSPAKEPSQEAKSDLQVLGSAAASNPYPNTNKEAPRPGHSTVSKSVSSNAYATGSSQNVGNVITDRPTSRVTQPPGGKSSISFF